MGKILITDDEEDIRDILEIILDSEFDNEIVKAESGNHAISILKEESNFDVILSDYTMNDGTGGDLYCFNRDHNNHPFILISGGYLEDYKEMSDFESSNQMNKFLEKPIPEDKLIDQVKKILNSQDKKPQEHEYIKININYLRKNPEQSFDIYIQLPGEKYLKIFKKEDPIDINRLNTYESKGQKHIHIRAEDFKSFYEKATECLFKKIKESTSSEMTFSLAGETISYTSDALENIGVNQSQFRLVNAAAEACIENLKNCDQINKVLGPLLKSQGYLISHSMTALHISHMIIKETKYKSSNILEKMAYASLLHDISLSKFDHLSEINCQDSDEFTKLKYDEKKIVLNHSNKSADLALKIKDIPNDVDNIIRDHHERPNSKGFPRGLSAGQINPLSCVFILSLEVADYFYFHKINNDSLAILIKHLRENFSSGNFAPPMKALTESVLKN